MSDCDISIGGGGCDYDGSPEFESTKLPKARKNYVCVECGRRIAVGDRYERISGKFDGGIYTYRTCLACSEIRGAFSGGDLAIGNLWEEFAYWFPDLKTSCFDKLETPEAKAYLRQRWMSWKGLAS